MTTDHHRLRDVTHVWDSHAHRKARAIAAWAKHGNSWQEREKRWQAIADFGHIHQIAAQHDHNHKRAQQFWHIHLWGHRKARAIRRQHIVHHPDDLAWPVRMHVTELFNNDNGAHNHVHVASTDRNALIAIGNIAVAHYGGAGMVREFPPFDPVECVHVTTSWHYRDSSNPFVARTCANRGDGCAMDLSFMQRQDLANEIKRRYGADTCDF